MLEDRAEWTTVASNGTLHTNAGIEGYTNDNKAGVT